MFKAQIERLHQIEVKKFKQAALALFLATIVAHISVRVKVAK